MGTNGCRIIGRIIDRKTKQAVPGLRVEAWDKDLIVDKPVGSAVTGETGGFRIEFDRKYFSRLFLKRRPDLFFKVFDDGDVIFSSEQSVLWNVDAGDKEVVLEIDAPCSGGGSESFVVEGQVISRSSLGVRGLRVVIMDKNVGGDSPVAEATTDDRGAYLATFSVADFSASGKHRPDIQACVYAGEERLQCSQVRYNAANREVLNVILKEEASRFLGSEYETLIAALAPHHKGVLGELEESEERQDLAYLANKSGWDARAVALAATADQFSVRSGGKGRGVIAPAFFYALFRAGLPTDEAALYRTGGETTEKVWTQAMAQGVIPASLETDVPRALEAFRKLASAKLLDSPALTGTSSLKEMLDVSLGDDEARHQEFSDIYERHRSDPPKLWEAVRDALGEDAERRLRIDGKLAFMTLNNAALIRKIHSSAGQAGLTDVRALVDAGYHRAAAWQPLLAGEPTPPEVPGEDDDEKRDRYAEALAAQVRLSFPTAVVADMVKDGETPLARAALSGPVHAFLTQHEGAFQIGVHPVEAFVKKNEIDVPGEVVREVARIQRVWPITPNHATMNTLLGKGVDSAYAVTRYDRTEFIQAFKDDLGGEANARLIHAKSREVHNTVLNVVLSYLTAARAPGVGVHSPPHILSPAPHASDVLASAKLEDLVGEMDFCACEHCRSILSPAAYLVDLLQFVDRDPREGAGTQNAQSVLFQRRPDIQHLPLTCENTLTRLPYIDLVNETLEYFVSSEDPAVDPPRPRMSLAGYEGHTTDKEPAKEVLRAAPTFPGGDVYDSAYTALGAALFPAPLPFHRPLENLRRFFDKFEAPLQDVMAALRQNENLDNPGDYGWRDVRIEELRLSRAEYRILTDRTIPLADLYGFETGTSEDDAVAALAKVKTFTRKVGISYEDLIEILQTRFVNPHAILIARFARLGVPFATLKALHDGDITDAQFEAAISPQVNAADYGGDPTGWVMNEANYRRIMDLVTLTNPVIPGEVAVVTNGTDAPVEDVDPLCSLESLEFRYVEPDESDDDDPSNDTNRVGAFFFVRLVRFIRLWKKLGWSIEQIDKAITALYPFNQNTDDEDDPDNLERLDNAFQVLLPQLAVVRRAMRTLGLNAKRDLLPLLACFGPIDTQGASSLYRQLFLRPASSEEDDPFADDGFGRFLTGAENLVDHGEALRAAFSLTADEFSLITDSLRYDADTPLGRTPSAEEQSSPADYRVENVSEVLRRGWLARKLQISVREFLALTKTTRIDPFAGPDLANPQILRLIDLVRRMREARVKPHQALFLVWNEDVSGSAGPEEGEVLDFARTLRSELATIESEFVVVDDPQGEVARERVALVYGDEAADHLFGLLNENLVTDVDYVQALPVLADAIMAAAPGAVAYDHVARKLSYLQGVMPDDVQVALKGVASVTAAFAAAVDALHAKTRSFFERYPDLRAPFDAFVASAEPLEAKRTALLAALLPELERQRKRKQALQSASAAAKADVALAGGVLENAQVLHASGDVALPAIEDLTAIGTPGLSAEFYFRATATDPVDETREAEPDLDYAPTGERRLPAAPLDGPISGVWSGFLEIPESAAYSFRIQTDAGATVALTVNGTPVPLADADGLWSTSVPLDLDSALHSIALTVENVRHAVSVRWQIPERPWEIIPARFLYNPAQLERLGNAYLRFLKVASLANLLQLTSAETVYFAAAADYRIGGAGWLNSLPLTGSPNDATATGLLAAFEALMGMARLKTEFSSEGDLLLGVLTDAEAEAGDPESQLYALTRWEQASVDALLARFGRTGTRADLASFGTFLRVHEAYAWVRKLGVSVGALLQAATNEPDGTVIRALQAALRARYDQREWLEVLTPINDAMRALQRDALVAFILHQMGLRDETRHIDTIERLFEYFLLDVGMEPCTMTSRVRLAISSVQLFIERCLMGLEPRVLPSTIRAETWEWMKRYRVWEANRKVFLWPENWAEPELRDDQSPFFKEALSELLQGDITDDRAAEALINYLAKLQEVAKLEPCGIYVEEYDADKLTDEVVHVVGRTAGANRKYYYRRRQGHSWTPWEHIKLEIEDNPVTPVVWNNRLFLFWLQIQKKSPLEPGNLGDGSSTSGIILNLSLSELRLDANSTSVAATKESVCAVLCWSEYLNGKWQAVKTSDVNQPTWLGDYDHAGSNAFSRASLFLQTREGQPEGRDERSGGLVIDIGGGRRLGGFLLHNTHSLPDTLGNFEDAPELRSTLRGRKLITTRSRHFVIRYLDGPEDRRTEESRFLLQGTLSARTVDAWQSLDNPWFVPFLYEDPRHVFYVTSTSKIVTVTDWETYDLTPSTIREVADIPRVVDRELRLIGAEPEPLVQWVPDDGRPIIRVRPGGGVTDPPLEEFLVNLPSNIRHVLVMAAPVQYRGEMIGPAGAIESGLDGGMGEHRDG